MDCRAGSLGSLGRGLVGDALAEQAAHRGEREKLIYLLLSHLYGGLLIDGGHARYLDPFGVAVQPDRYPGSVRRLTARGTLALVATPSNISDPVLVAATTAQSFTLAQARNGVDLAVVFYDTAEALPGDEIAAGSGSRTLTVTGVARGFAPDGYQPADPGLGMLYDGGVLTTLAARTLKSASFGNQSLKSFSVSATAGADPGGAVSYRIWVYA